VDEELVELLQATAVRAKKAKSARLIRMDKSLRQEVRKQLHVLTSQFYDKKELRWPP
jgi:hypothetical protein